MNNKKKQTAMVAMAAVLSVTTIVSPLPVMAQENPAPVLQQTQQQQGTPAKETAPDIVLPEDLQTAEGTALQEITLPENWTWADGSTLITAEQSEYPARISVNDETYDYTVVEGYNAEGHYVERNIAVTVTEQEPLTESTESEKQVTTFGVNFNKDVFSAKNADEIIINEQTFPDDTFREYVKEFDRDKNRKLSANEIANVTTLYADGINGKGAIKTLKGIEYFTSLEKLYCYNTQISELDVSRNIALVHLSCGDTPLLKLNVSENKELEYLDFANTKIKEIDVSKNLKLKRLGCANTDVEKIEVNTNLNLNELYIGNTRITQLNVRNNEKLTHLDCAKTDITSLDVSKNPALIQLYCDTLDIDKLELTNNPNLTHVWCNDTNIKELNVSKNTALVTLECYKTELQNLDVSKNTKLTTLSCSQTPIKELDVTMLPELKYLYTWATDIEYLDVSQNPNLLLLDTPRTNLGYLDWGANDLNELYMDLSSNIDLVVDNNTFSITQKFKGINIDKIKMISGGSLDKDKGIVKDYKAGTPIVYEYTCGTSKGVQRTLTVTLNLSKSLSKIDITGNLDVSYTGNAVADPAIDKMGSTGEVTFVYEMWNGNAWEMYNGTPVNAGKYRVTAHLAENDFFNSAEATKEFTISQATNNWTEELSIKNWAFDEKPNTPSAKAKFGTDINYTYSDSKDGRFTNIVPTNAGTWYVKATVAETDNYTGLENVLAFTISPKSAEDNKNIIVPDINSDKDVENLVIKDGDKELKEGTDYEFDKKQDGNKVTVTITFKGNYTGTVTKTYTVEDKKPSGGNGTDTNKPSGNAKDDKSNAVQTGDNSKIGLLATMSLLSAGFIAFLTGKKRKNIKDN